MQTVRTRNTFIEVLEHEGQNVLRIHSRKRLNSCPGYLEKHSSEWDTLSTVASCDSPIDHIEEGTVYDPVCLMRPRRVIIGPATTRAESYTPDVLHDPAYIDFISNSIGSPPPKLTREMSSAAEKSKTSVPMSTMTRSRSSHGRESKAKTSRRGVKSQFKMLHEKDHMDYSIEDWKRNTSCARNRLGVKSTQKVFVGGLSPSTEPASLRQYFSRFGSIKACGVVKNFHGVSKRFGYCEFLAEESVFEVLSHPRHFVDGASISVRPYCLRD